MTTADHTGGATFLVVVNDEEQYSIWPADRPAPAGWHDVGMSGSEDECVAHIDRVWKDIRPRSVRERLAPPPPVDDRLVSLVAEVLEAEPAGLSDTTGAATDGRWTSLKHIELITTIEAAFGVSFSHAEIRGMTSLAVIRSTLRGKGLAP